MDLIISSGYPSPYGNISEELKAAQADPSEWYPMTVDFRATAVHSGGGDEAASFEQLLSVIDKKKPGSITELGLVGHASPVVFSLAGSKTIRNIHFDPKGIIHPDPFKTTSLRSRLFGNDSKPTTKTIRQASRSSPATQAQETNCWRPLAARFK
jgi:hypothetical protein